MSTAVHMIIEGLRTTVS